MIRALLAAAALLASTAAAAQTYVVRHLDTPAGERDPDLLPKGKAGAEALTRWFRGKRLSAIYVSDFRRTRQTAAPLAAAHKLFPKVYDPADTPGLLARVATEQGPVLIIGHSNTVPDIVTGLGGDRPAPLAHPDFGDIWIVGNGRTERVKFAP